MYTNQIPSQEKAQRNKSFGVNTLQKQQIDSVFELLNSSRGALKSVANAFIAYRFHKGPHLKVAHKKIAVDAGYKARKTGWSTTHKLMNSPFMIGKRNRIHTEDGWRDEAYNYELNPLLTIPYARKKLGTLLPAMWKFRCLSHLLSQSNKQQTYTLYKEILKGVSLVTDFSLTPQQDLVHKSLEIDSKFDYGQFCKDIGATTLT